MNNLDSRLLCDRILTKRPTTENQRKKSFTLQMSELVRLVQGSYDEVAICRKNNTVKLFLTASDVLTLTTITPYIDHDKGWAFYVVDYGNLV